MLIIVMAELIPLNDKRHIFKLFLRGVDGKGSDNDQANTQFYIKSFNSMPVHLHSHQSAMSSYFHL